MFPKYLVTGEGTRKRLQWGLSVAYHSRMKRLILFRSHILYCEETLKGA